MHWLRELLDRKELHIAAVGVSTLLALSVFVLSDRRAEAPEPRPFVTPGATERAAPQAPATAVLAATATPLPERTGRIFNTQGLGLRVRTACLESAPGTGGLGEGAIVTIVREGEPECAGWVQVRLGDSTSWVREIFLERTP